MIITKSEDLRNLTGSFYANNDFSKIENTIKGVETDICRILGMQSLDGLAGDAKLAAQQAVAFMATMRFYRLNDISHENAGRKVKIDKENEARPFEWQLARDDRTHLEEYYRALDRLVFCLMGNENFHQSALYQRIQKVIIGNADELTWLTGIEPSPWLYIQLLPFLLESQQFVEKAYGEGFIPGNLQQLPDTDTADYAAKMATALGAIALMGRRTSLQALPYGLMQLTMSNGGGNTETAPSIEQLNAYLKQLSIDQRYWINEMKRLRDLAAGKDPTTHLQMPENDKHHKFMRV